VNPINYARGLLTELGAAAGDHREQVLAELRLAAEHAREFGEHMGAEVAEMRAAVLADAAAVLDAPKATARKTAAK
jgi:hypothetical protein